MSKTKIRDRGYRLLWGHHSIEKRSYRFWWYARGVNFLTVETGVWSSLLGVGLSQQHGKWCLSFCLGLVYLYASVPGKYRNYGDDREFNISFHNGGVWWSFWNDPNSWSSKTPKWKHGNFNFIDFALGRSNCTHTLVEERNVLIPMPEKAYQATAKLEDWVWRRPRWFAKRLKRVTIDIPNGIPKAGKGENSWDCGDDATFGMTTGECNSIPEGVGQLVTSMLKDRVRYGGWKDWSWKREETPNA